MTGVKFSCFKFKGIIYEKLRAQTRKGVVTPRRQAAFGMEVCFGIKMILKRAKFMRGYTSARFRKPVGSESQMSCLSVLEDHFFPLYHHRAWPRNLHSAPSSMVCCRELLC